MYERPPLLHTYKFMESVHSTAGRLVVVKCETEVTEGREVNFVLRLKEVPSLSRTVIPSTYPILSRDT